MADPACTQPNPLRRDINVTPLVDVVLVLLIIYLVALPVVLRSITIDIPRKAEGSSYPSISELRVEVAESGMIRLNGPRSAVLG